MDPIASSHSVPALSWTSGLLVAAKDLAVATIYFFADISVGGPIMPWHGTWRAENQILGAFNTRYKDLPT